MSRVHCILRSHRPEIDFPDVKLKTVLSKTTRHRALIFGMKHHLVDLYQVCTNYAPGAKMAPSRGGGGGGGGGVTRFTKA